MIEDIINALKDSLQVVAPVYIGALDTKQIQNSGSKIALNVYEINYNYEGDRPFATASISILYWGADYFNAVERIKAQIYNTAFNQDSVVDAKIEKIVFSPVLQGGTLVGIKFVIKYYEETIRRI